MAEIAEEVDDAEGGVGGREGEGDGQGAVAAAVVDEDDFVGAGEALANGFHAAHEIADTALLVVAGGDDREPGGGEGAGVRHGPAGLGAGASGRR